MGNTSRSLTVNIVTHIADREGCDPCELKPPLYETIDLDALESLFRSRHGEVRFTYLGYHVIAQSDGSVTTVSIDS